MAKGISKENGLVGSNVLYIIAQTVHEVERERVLATSDLPREAQAVDIRPAIAIHHKTGTVVGAFQHFALAHLPAQRDTNLGED